MTALAGAGALAGCSDDDPEPGLYALSARVAYGPNAVDVEYPSDVGVEVEVQNTDNERRQGQLVVELRHVEGAGDDETVTDTWTKRRPVNLGRGSAQAGILVVFEDVGTAEDSLENWDAEARIETDEE